MCFSFLLFCLSSLGIRREDRVYSPQTRVSWLRQRRKRSGALLKEADVPNVRPRVLPARHGSQPARAWAGPRAPGWGLGASLLCAPVPFCHEQGARPGQSHGKIRAEKTSPPFVTLWFCVSCCAGDVELGRLWASSERL